MLMQKPK